jgi:diguanylate cyclase (GGDEF)-like protein
MDASILTIDDSLPMHRLIQSVFGTLGVAFHTAYDGIRGLSLAAHYRPNVILLDVDLPGMDGFEVCRRLKNSKETSPIPVIFVTAVLAKQDKSKGIELGAADYITKPFTPESLLASVQSSIKTREAEPHSDTPRPTGLRSRADLEAFLATKEAAVAEGGKSLACIACDVDELRIINGRFGTSGGDEVISRIGEMLVKHSRPGDMIAEWGAGRFVIAAPGLDRRDAGRMAERLSAKIKDLEVLGAGTDSRVTCTFGVADSAVAAGQPLLERAHGALKRAKLNGRASVSVARPPR